MVVLPPELDKMIAEARNIANWIKGNDDVSAEETIYVSAVNSTFNLLVNNGWHLKGKDCLKPRQRDFLLMSVIEELKNKGWHDPGDCPSALQKDLVTIDEAKAQLISEGYRKPTELVTAQDVDKMYEKLGWRSPEWVVNTRQKIIEGLSNQLNEMVKDSNAGKGVDFDFYGEEMTKVIDEFLVVKQ